MFKGPYVSIPEPVSYTFSHATLCMFMRSAWVARKRLFSLSLFKSGGLTRSTYQLLGLGLPVFIRALAAPRTPRPARSSNHRIPLALSGQNIYGTVFPLGRTPKVSGWGCASTPDGTLRIRFCDILVSSFARPCGGPELGVAASIKGVRPKPHPQVKLAVLRYFDFDGY